MDPWKIYMDKWKLLSTAVSAKTVGHAHAPLQKAIEYVQICIREFQLVEGIQQTEFDTIMSIGVVCWKWSSETAEVSKHQMFFKCWQKVTIGKTVATQPVQLQHWSKHTSIIMQSSHDSDPKSDSLLYSTSVWSSENL